MKETNGIKLSVDPKSVRALEKAILKILKARVDNKTIRHALDTLSKSVSVNGNVVSGCRFDISNSKGEEE